MLDKPSINFVCMFYSTVFDLRRDNRLLKILERKLKLGDELRDDITNYLAFRHQIQGGSTLFQMPGNHLFQLPPQLAVFGVC